MRMSNKMDQVQLQAAVDEKVLQITTQGGAVRALKDRVKAKKKAKVCPDCTVFFSHSVSSF